MALVLGQPSQALKRASLRLAQFLVVALLLSLLAIGESSASIINPGDIVIADQFAFGGAVIHIDPVTGAQTVVSSGGSFVNPLGVAVGGNAQIYVADTGVGVIQVDPATGIQTIVSTGGRFALSGPRDLAVAANGDIFVVDELGLSGTGEVIRIDPMTGGQTLISSDDDFVNAVGIALAANGDILVVDQNAFSGSGGVIRVDPVLGTQTTVSSGGDFVEPFGIAIALNGDIFITDPDAFGGAVFRVDPMSGIQTLISFAGGLTQEARGVALATNGDIFVALRAAPAVIRIDLGGVQSTVSAGGSFDSPVGIDVAPAFIDIKPGSFPNSINPRSRGTVPVAILSTDNFDAANDVDTTSLTFGATGDEESLKFCNPSSEDVNGDGLPDLVCHFDTQTAGFQPGDTAGILRGQTISGTPLKATDAVRLVPPK